MMRLRPSGTIRAAFLLCCLASFAQGYGQTSSGDGDVVYHLHGTVVDGVTGKPLARVLVMSADRRMAVMTGNEGQFAVDLSVPSRSQNSGGTSYAQFAGSRRFSQQVYLNLQKPGYVSPDQPQAFPLDDTLSSTNLQLKLMPAATISGHVSASNVDSFANVYVTLMDHQSFGDGNLTWRQTNTTATNARGEFHFSDLRPGEYTIVTGEWRGDQPFQQPGMEITERYPPTYYGDVSSLDASLKLHLHYGEDLRPELHLHLATYYPVSVPVTSSTPNFSVTARVVNQNLFNSFQLRYDQRSGSIEGSLPNGQYTLLLTGAPQLQAVGLQQRSAQQPSQPQRSFALVNLDVAGVPVQTAPVALSPSSPISIQVHSQLTQTTTSSSPNPGRAVTGGGGGAGIMDMGSEGSVPLVQLSLQSEDAMGGYSSTPSQPGHYDELILQNVPPGHYNVHFQAMRGYVASASCAGVDLLQQPLVVGTGGSASPVEVVIRDDNPQLSGTVTSSGTPLPSQIFLVLLPTDGTAQFTISSAGPDGKFTVRNLAPGSYRVLAVPSLNRQFQIPYRDAEVMHHFDGKGSTFTAGPGQVLSIEVPFSNDADLTGMEGK